MRAAVKVGAGRELVIPQKFHQRLGLAPGDTLELTVERGRLVLTPKADLEKRLAESFEDFKKGRTLGPFKSAKEAMRALRKEK
jgi:AbrB family looped-hinge helix DNA binding protein